ncbi:hypothetical protein AGMMS49579_07640 [Spirochaetia bacterium]|nr:hypothetical protein AGMMS49579_07640 [Spirochaetia bacterium]
MKRGTLRVVLAGLVILSLLAACNKAKPADGAGAPAEITVEVFDRGTDGGRSDPTNNNWTKWIQEKLLKDENIKVTFVAVPRGSETTTLNNMMAAGDAPNICLTYDGGLIAQYRDLGGIFDMSPYIEPLMPDLKKFLGPDLALPGNDFIYRNQDRETGKVFAIPGRRTNLAQRGTFIRGDWLEKLGLKPPATTQEFYDVLLAFKTQDPGGVGASRVVPFTMGSGVWFDAANLIESFIDVSLSDKDHWINNVANREFLQPGYKEGVRFMNKMYNAGLIDRDFPLNKADEQYTLLKSGAAGSFQQNWDQPYRDSPGILRDLQTNVPGATLIPIDPFTNSRGVTYKNMHDAAGVNYFIPTAAKNPEAALRYLNWLARFENYNFLQIGEEGVTHDLGSDDIPKIKPGAGLWIQNSPQNIDYTPIINGLDLGDPEKTAKGLATSYTVDAQLIIDANALSLKNGKPMPIVPATLSVAGPYTQTLQDKGTVLLTEAITCAPAQFDRVWDAGIADWLASGGTAIRDERTAKYIAP